MGPPEPKVEEQDEALAWRNRLSLQLLRGFLLLFLVGEVLLWTLLEGQRERYWLSTIVGVVCLLAALPAITGRPRGSLRGWILIVPALITAISAYALLGFLSGPGAALTITLMVSGVLLGTRVMVGLIALAALAVCAVAWAMVSGHLPPPHPKDVSMTSALPWARSLTVTFFAISFFGVLMVAVINRIEHALRLARSETLLREQAERARAEAEIVALEAKQLETIGRLAAGVAHDFNNNLTAIIGCAELLKMELPEKAQSHELADAILQSSHRAAELTRQLLVYSRKAQMLQTPTDLHKVVDEAVSFLRRSVDPKVSIVADLTATRSTVVADASLLHSALLNLLVNAHDAMPGGGTLTVSTMLVDLPEGHDGAGPVGPCVLLEVLDTGHGIPSEHLPRIFDPFFTTKPVGKGTGLGLAAVAGTIKAHGGKIEVESEVGHGTAFRIYLPVVLEPTLSRSEVMRLVRGEGEVLLVDDDAMVSLAAVTTLTSLGYRVTRVSNGAAAVSTVTATPNRFRLILLDLRMPGMSGEATFDALRALAPKLPILIWSGYGAEQDVTGMLLRGAAGFVQKPYRVAELSQTIAEAIQGSRRLDQRPAAAAG